MLLSYGVTYIPMKKEDHLNGYPCVGLVIGKHRGYISENNEYTDGSHSNMTKYHLFSELMIGIMPTKLI